MRVVALVAVLAVSVPATTQADDAAAARFFDRMARRDFADGRYVTALESFVESYRFAPSPRTAFNVAVSAQQAGRSTTAVNFYATYLASAPEGADDGRRAAAEAAIDQLRAETPLVRVSSDPPGATVRVDSSARGSHGRTPLLLAVDPGQRRLVLELDGYRPREIVIEAERGVERRASVELTPHRARLRVDALPSDATVVVMRDGHEITRGPTPLERTLPVGRYRVRVEAEGFLPRSAGVRLVRGRRAQLRLTGRARPDSASRLLVSTGDVMGAEVRLDGRWIGTTPLTLPRALPGERRLDVRARGHRPWRGTVTLERGGVVHVPIELQPTR